ncbi:MAG TPA: flavodoxin family protein [Dehalococcoidia bacterium]|jgi:multimeric flavodoxin WrbA|nr:flavodoxin family protein [Dehalococcoidia bacterium]
MMEPVLTEEAQEIWDTVLSMSLSFKRETTKGKYIRILSLLMQEQDVKEAGKELVIEAIRMVEGKRFDNHVFRRIEDPATYKRLVIDPKTDLDAYFALPIQVKRWDIPSSKPTKSPKEMKVIAVNGSPRRGGNGDVLIDEALRGAEDAGASVEKIMLQKIKLNFCISCYKCEQPGWAGFCSQKDDVNGVFQKMADSDAIIIGFPVYMGRESGQLCIFFDRWYCLSGGKLGAGKRGMVIGTYGSPFVDSFYDSVIEKVMFILTNFGIEPVEVLSACGFIGVLGGLDDKGKAMILRFPKELEKAYQAGKSLVAGES